ncbi:Hypothetical predicted protein [Paramuricea clavata]|uniref:Uncharacterized protein n=1 Tax=Paramuricea clavata TaxID=317549 RepID=A0A7D9D6A4_PARCT|nr:Hypothetical predicted protein [Paramuricea clavata]
MSNWIHSRATGFIQDHGLNIFTDDVCNNESSGTDADVTSIAVEDVYDSTVEERPESTKTDILESEVDNLRTDLSHLTSAVIIDWFKKAEIIELQKSKLPNSVEVTEPHGSNVQPREATAAFRNLKISIHVSRHLKRDTHQSAISEDESMTIKMKNESNRNNAIALLVPKYTAVDDRIPIMKMRGFLLHRCGVDVGDINHSYKSPQKFVESVAEVVKDNVNYFLIVTKLC